MRLPKALQISFVMLFLSGCTTFQHVSLEQTPIPTLIPATLPSEMLVSPVEPKTTAEPESLTAPFAGLPLPTERGVLFSASGNCAICHTDMVDESGTDVSIDHTWQSSMLANSARDPYWQASVRGEVRSSPAYSEVIQDKCATCHMPMARFTAASAGETAHVLDDGLLNPGNAGHTLAMDGVSCTLCHQIEAADLGNPSTFSGGYVIDAGYPEGERPSYGPLDVDDTQSAVMQAASGFVPRKGLHLAQSDVCASCHNLFTPTIDENGEIVGEFPEQAIHLEWLHSAYAKTRSCQDCHMPEVEDAIRLSITGGEPRAGFSEHSLTGANVYMLELLSTHGKEMGSPSSSERFEAARERTLDQLQNRTAAVSIREVAVSGSQLTTDVVVESHTGHKLPAGFPSRRVWLHFVVLDSEGEVLFQSGAYESDGSIHGNDNDSDPTLFEPHYEMIDSPDQVQIYEGIMQDADGRVTTTLLRGAGYAKDNRLLPAGFDKASAPPDVAVHGRAAGDASFTDGSDTIRYSVDLESGQGPLSIEVRLLYQPIGFRWADNLRMHGAPEPERFLAYYESVPNVPAVIATDTWVNED